MSNYATKSDFKSATDVDILTFVKEGNLASLKSDIDALDIEKLKAVPVDLYKLSSVVEKEVVKKTGYDESVKKINVVLTIDNSDLVKKYHYSKIDEIEKKIPDHDTYSENSR